MTPSPRLTDPPGRGPVVLNDRALAALVRYYAPLMGLSDWSITVAVARTIEHDHRDRDNSGTIIFSRTERRARILILHQADHGERQGWEQDMEKTLVHEMLHLVFLDYDGDDPKRPHTREEQAINSLAKGMVFLRRAKGRERGPHV